MNDSNTKAKIIETMYHLIAEKGYDKSSIGQIAEAIGIKKASIYYYFKSKEDIFLEMVKGLYEEDYYDRSELFDKNIDVNSYEKELISVGFDFIDSYFGNKDLRKVYAEIDLQTTRIAKLKVIINISDENINKFLIKCLVHGVEIGAFPQDFDIKINSQILYTLLVGIDQSILYEFPIDSKAVWKETILKLF
ncbi:MAG: TetR/AcrR family transcriptional regulator [Oscillospiraceae bacterium]